MDVSIIVVAWNVRKLVYDCLKSVYDETKGIEFEVIYVDNASEDGSVEMLRKDFPEVRIIENNENKGFIKANNQGIEISKGRYVLLLNSDTLILNNAIVRMLECADEHPEAAVVGCKVLSGDRTLRRTCFMYPSVLNMFLSATYLQKMFPKSKFFGRERMTWWNFDDVREVETVSGCCSMVRKEAIDEVGMMDPTYFVYGDDPDWCYRFKKNGWKVLFTPEPEIIHYGGQNTKNVARAFKLQLYGSILIFVRLHRSRTEFAFCCILTALFFLVRVPYWLIMAMLSKDESKTSAKIAGTYLVGCFYCLSNWKNLLMNKEQVCKKL